MATSDGIAKKTEFIPFINVGTDELPKFIRIKKSTVFDLSFSPEISTFDFISSNTPEEELKSYKVALAQELTMFKGEEDYKVIFKHCFELLTGGDAKRKVIIAFVNEPGTQTEKLGVTVYKAWQVNALVKVNNLNSVNQTITFDLALNDPAKGAISLEDSMGELVPTFTEGTWDDENVFTPKAPAA